MSRKGALNCLRLIGLLLSFSILWFGRDSHSQSTDGKDTDPESMVFENATIDFKKQTESTWLGTKYIVAPVTVPVDIALKLYEGRELSDILIEDTKYVLGYVTLVVVGGKIVDNYYSQNLYDFNETIDRQRTEAAKSILAVINMGESSRGTEAYLESLRETYPADKLKIISGRDSQEISRQLRELPQNAQFDRLDWVAHGAPGKIGKLNSGNVTGRPELNLVRPGGELRLYSCLVARDGVFHTKGREFTSKMGQWLLPNGGSVYASTKIIRTSNRTPEARREMMGLLNRIGIGGIKRAIEVPIGMFYARPIASLLARRADVLEIVKSSNCAITYGELMKWHKH